MATPIITAEHVDDKIIGIREIIEAVVGAARTERIYLEKVLEAQGRFERELWLQFETKIIKMHCTQRGLTSPADYDVEEQPWDWATRWYPPNPSLLMRKRPVRSFERVWLEFHDGSTMMDLPEDWWQPDYDLGLMKLFPHGIAPAESANQWLMLLFAATGYGHTIVPKFVCVDYTAGYADAAGDDRLLELRGWIARDAAWRVLEAGQQIVPTQQTREGYAVSWTDPSQRIEKLQAEIADYIRQQAAYVRPPPVVFV